MDFLKQDPILQSSRNYERSIPELEQENERYAQRIQEIKQSNFGHQQSKSPTWDEIDRIISSLSEKEVSYLQSNEEFIHSSNTVQTLLQQEFLRIMRPIVEGTKEGKDALDKHLTLVKRLIKSAKEEVAQKDALFQEYITEYSNMTWNEFINMKNKK